MANKARITTSPTSSWGWWLSWWQLSLAPREEKEEEEDPPSLSDPLSSVATTWSSVRLLYFSKVHIWARFCFNPLYLSLSQTLQRRVEAEMESWYCLIQSTQLKKNTALRHWSRKRWDSQLFNSWIVFTLRGCPTRQRTLAQVCGHTWQPDMIDWILLNKINRNVLDIIFNLVSNVNRKIRLTTWTYHRSR